MPQTILFVVDHQSDFTEAPVSCVGQDVVSAADCNSVLQARFSGTQVLELRPFLFGSVDVSEALEFIAPVPTTVERQRYQHKRRLTNGPVRAAITRSKVQQPYSRACVPETASASDPVGSAEPDGPQRSCWRS